MGSTSDAEEIAIVLVDHGSKRAEANAMLEDFADLYRSAACHLMRYDGVQDIITITHHANACISPGNVCNNEDGSCL